MNNKIGKEQFRFKIPGLLFLLFQYARGAELYHGKPVFYNLGSLFMEFVPDFSPSFRASCLLYLRLGKVVSFLL